MPDSIAMSLEMIPHNRDLQYDRVDVVDETLGASPGPRKRGFWHFARNRFGFHPSSPSRNETNRAHETGVVCCSQHPGRFSPHCGMERYTFSLCTAMLIWSGIPRIMGDVRNREKYGTHRCDSAATSTRCYQLGQPSHSRCTR